MAKKKGPKDTPGDVTKDFTRVLEKQRKEMERLTKPFFEYPKRMERMVKPFLEYQQRTERMAKPILEYQQKLLDESIKFQEAWAQNVVETIEKVMDQLIEEQRRRTEEANRLISEMDLPDPVRQYIQGSQKVQEMWTEQIRKSTEMVEGFIKGTRIKSE